MITWEDFNITNKNNKQTAFENMCRIFFNYYFFNNRAIFKQKYNNSGIEIEPIQYQGKLISFQAKYIESGNVYGQIRKSMTTAIKEYSGELDIIYIFTNKDLNVKSKEYQDIVAMLNAHNISIERICNLDILSIIETKKYDTLKKLFFGKHNLTKEWFDNNLRTSLEDLEPRYVSGFNVDTSTQKYFEIKYMGEEIYDELTSILTSNRENLSNLCSELLEQLKTKEERDKTHEVNVLTEVKSIYSKLNNLIIPDQNSFASIFEWINLFKNEKEKLDEQLIEINKQLNTIQDTKAVSLFLKIREYIYRALDVIEELDMSQNTLFNSYNSNILLIEGEAGAGKSHLLGYEAEKHGNALNRTILLLGHKLISSNSPIEQIKEQLNTELSVNELLDIFEGMGEIDNSNTVIMIDALNESKYYQVWTNFLNDLVNRVEKYNHIKLIATVRTTYINLIFSHAIKNKIINNQITKITHRGFEGIVDDAVEKFFTYYKIPVITSLYSGYSFKNPLFLKIFCTCYADSKEKVGSKSITEIFNKYIEEEECKIKRALCIIDEYHYCHKILENMADYLYANKTGSIDLETLYRINKDIPRHEDIIPLILKSKILISYFYNDVDMIYFSYERMCDVLIAMIIVNKCTTVSQLRDIVSNDLLAVNKYDQFIRTNAIGIFSALSIFVSEKFNEELLSIIKDVKLSDYNRKQLVEDYLQNLIFRQDQSIDKNKLLEVLKQEINSCELKDVYLNTLLLLAGRKYNALNAMFLHSVLSNLTLSKRDYFWTIFINYQNDEACSLRHTINYFLKKQFTGDYDVKKLYAVLLIWVLTSSNRSIRDNASRSIINLLKNDYKLMLEVLDLFYNTNDPYVVQRLYGIIYGAILKSEINCEELTKISQKVFTYVFNTEKVYPDILLRDYALNIIEYAKYSNCNLDFDIKKCRPPYKSNDINVFDKDIENCYDSDYKQLRGTRLIKSSILPNLDDWYGDFGRYVFQAAISEFKNVNIKNAYLYALDYIKNVLGYDDELFSGYDHHIYGFFYERHQTVKIERIGKKYEWIAFYHILACVSDNYKLSSDYSDHPNCVYRGSWNPYVRDFDPTLDLINNDRVYNLNVNINQPIYDKWSNDPDWAKNKDDVINFSELIFLTDNNEEDWIFLHGHVKFQSSDDYNKDYQEIWRMVSAYVISKEEYDNFISKLSGKQLWGRWFPEIGDRYNVFNREYSWSPAYKDEYYNDTFDVEIDTGKTVQKKIHDERLAALKKIINEDFEPSSEKEEFTYTEVIKENIGSVKPLWNSYLWEEQYDASKTDVVGFDIPAKEIIDYYNLSQKKSGLFYKGEELIVADFSLVQGGATGLYIKKSYLDEFLEGKNYKIFWVCIGEKNDIKKENIFTVRKGGGFYDFSSLIYYKDNEIKDVSYFSNRYEH